MTNLLKDQEGVAAIQADIIVFGTSVVEHDARLQQVFADHWKVWTEVEPEEMWNPKA